MFVIEPKIANAAIRDQSEIDLIVNHLESIGYRGVLRSLLRVSCECAGIDVQVFGIRNLLGNGASTPLYDDSDEDVLRRLRYGRLPWTGDIFFCNENLFMIQPLRSKLQVMEVRHHKSETKIETFCADVVDGATNNIDKRRLRGMKFQWSAIQLDSTVVRRRGTADLSSESELKTKPPQYSSVDLQRARLILPSEQRSFLMRLAKALGKSRSVDAEGISDLSSIQSLFDVDIVHKEYLVLCRADSHTICTVSDRAQIESPSGGNFRCTVCDRCLKDELIQEIYVLTETGRNLISSSHWMTIWITDILVSSGIPRERISWNVEAGGDELDIMVDVLGLRVFFELKDREFGLGDAYPFATRVARYGGDFGVVVSTEKVAEDAKKFFEEQRTRASNLRGVQIESVEGQSAVEARIPELVDRWSRIAVNRIFEPIAERLPLDLTRIISAWMDRMSSTYRA